MTQPFYASSAINRHGDYRNNDKLLNCITTEKNTIISVIEVSYDKD